MKVIHILAIAVLMLIAVTAFVYAVKPLLIKDDCIFAAKTIETIEYNRSAFNSSKERREALKPHQEFIAQYCTE
ncbi:hypothetical protein VOWphi5012_093 [Vibrio phage phi50-12]|uniref:Uncharacterized protein n=1 Tax=Vibrio phage phi50-12 TaxID=2654972 RepID=A0A5P8PRF7_9CAUD|nr:hypothetical protein KNU82_gp093 [Vibrio phage phi50-12]QFR59877.1 hypothetical protein VOWphi5012_093 [Vibrio phage phi50-12]